MTDPRTRFHELVGAIILEWAYFDQVVVRQIWAAKSAGKKKPFIDIDFDNRFVHRFKEWRSLHAAHCSPEQGLNTFCADAKRLALIRHDLAHNVTEIMNDGPDHEAVLAVMRSRHDLATKFREWFEKRASLAPKNWKPPPQVEHDFYQPSQLVDWLAEIRALRTTLTAIGAARAGGYQCDLR